MEPLWTGPYHVVAVGLNDTYYLMKPNGQRLDTPISKDQLSLFLPTDLDIFYSGNQPLQELQDLPDTL